VYEDVKGVISDLITNEVATTTVEQLSCRAGHVQLTDKDSSRPDVVTLGDKDKPRYYQLTAIEHFPRSLQALHDHQFGGIKTTIIDESANLAGYLVYQALTKLEPVQNEVIAPYSVKADLVGDAAKFVSQAHLTTSALEAASSPQGAERVSLAARRSITLAETEKLAGQTTLKTTPQAKAFFDDPTWDLDACAKVVGTKFDDGIPLGTSPLDQACAKPANDTERIDCELAFALRSAIQGDGGAEDQHVRQAVADILAELVNHTLTSAPLNAIVQSVDTTALSDQFSLALEQIQANPSSWTILFSKDFLAGVLGTITFKQD